ncbi:ABC transporter ATP-binding protein [Oculatella sp. FACHB-28]|uniref:ABC transporter ATP-binding protein n=1 Tax=Cyanophyceae TaxID=3028117 RepID=UPI001688F1D4|nr:MULTISPECIES: ABC transporter ATP-binding protein [Cyanophyceae]MBD2057476.1 ABC transporter ATP-binding protein [Oculatella sp. FACHB-28]MBD2068760.1 ABC transporter ATP-binding protein [Leptolyngbya sp. FACHB-671]
MNAYSQTVISPSNPAVRGEAIAQISELGLTFGAGNAQVEVLKSINLEIKAGDFVCVLGSSGCGKTTLLRALAGYQRPTQGTVTVSGKAHTKPDANVGVVFQRPNLFPWLTIAKNVEFGPKMRQISKQERRQRVSYYLEMVGLDYAARLLPYQLSGGMQQRAAIARTLAANPSLILMDEPFGALDALTRESMQTHLRDIWHRTGKTIFFITHDVEEAMLLSTRLLVMHARPGRIVKDITNPFANRLGKESTASLRSSKEFIEVRESLVSGIREPDKAHGH